jgi:DinB superfamily
MPTMEEYAKLPHADRLQRLERTPDELAAVIKDHGAATLAKRPDAKNWAAVEIICHLRDADEAFNGRFQMFLAMDDVKLLPIDTDRLAVDRQYARCDAAQAIEAFRGWRSENLATFRKLDAAEWKRGGTHPQRGRLTFEDFLSLMCWHDDNHLDQLRRAIAGQP